MGSRRWAPTPILAEKYYRSPDPKKVTVYCLLSTVYFLPGHGASVMV